MDLSLSRRSKPDFQSEFLATIFKANTDPNLFTFAGGNPNSESFPVAEMNAAADRVLRENGVMALQYSGTQGYLPLRQYIADRYRASGLTVDSSEVIITNGSQQALDLISAMMIDSGDRILVESPTYLAALQTFHLYDPEIIPVPLCEDGIDVDALQQAVGEMRPKFMYLIPNFQNPTGLSYSEEVRSRASEIFRSSNVLVLEDNPYGELRFQGQPAHSFGWYLGEQCCLLGTFSKTISPGMRIGWIVCRQKELLEKMIVYKATLDLHTNIFGQMVLYRYLTDHDLDVHLAEVRRLYQYKAEYMIACIEKYFPAGCRCTHPAGGMFLWVTLPDGIRGVDVQRESIARGFAVCAGDPFYEYERNVPHIRLNFSNGSDEQIDSGMRVVGEVIRDLMTKLAKEIRTTTEKKRKVT